MNLNVDFSLMISILFLCFCSVTYAQKGDVEAKKILDKVTANFKSYKGVKAVFTYTIQNSEGQTISNDNGIVKMEGNKYYVSLSDQEIFSDGITTWNYSKENNEVIISKIDENEDSFSPQKLFSNFYEKDLLYKLNGLKNIGRVRTYEIEMTPTDKSQPFYRIYLYIDKQNYNIIKTTVYEKSGNKYVYLIKSFRKNVKFPGTAFVFVESKYSDIEVVDLR